MHIEVPALRYSDLQRASEGESSSAVRQRVCAARKVQQQRLGPNRTNGTMTAREIKKHCPLDDACHELLRHVIDDKGGSARTCDRLLRVALTIADLDLSNAKLGRQHLLEAINFRNSSLL
jgi:magnesium chelatase family protein